MTSKLFQETICLQDNYNADFCCNLRGQIFMYIFITLLLLNCTQFRNISIVRDNFLGKTRFCMVPAIMMM